MTFCEGPPREGVIRLRCAYLELCTAISSRKRVLPHGGHPLKYAASDSTMGQRRVGAVLAAIHAIEGHHRITRAKEPLLISDAASYQAEYQCLPTIRKEKRQSLVTCACLRTASYLLVVCGAMHCHLPHGVPTGHDAAHRLRYLHALSYPHILLRITQSSMIYLCIILLLIRHIVTDIEIHAFRGIPNSDNRLSFTEGKARPCPWCGFLRLSTNAMLENQDCHKIQREQIYNQQ